MPLARIFTRYPEHAGDLAQQLEIEGFSVELAGPDETHLLPADLEIDFDICNPAEVLELASRRATELGADVAVASGVMDLVIVPASTAPVELLTAEAVELEAEPYPLQAAAVPAIRAHEEESSHELPAYNTHFAANLGTQMRELLNGLSLTATELKHRLTAHLRATAGSTRSRMATAKANLISIADSIASRAREHQQMRQRAAEAQADLEQRPVEVASQQVEISEAAAEQGEQSELLATAPGGQQLRRPPNRVPATQPKLLHLRRAQLRGIFTGAAAASALFIIGMVLANVHQQSPLPASMTQKPVEQHVPFGAVIVQGNPARSSVNVVQPQSVQPHATLKPQEPAPAVNHRKPHPYHRIARVHDSENDITADDVVVRHFPAQARRPAQQVQQVTLKRYSDLN
jgi:hypothetical protein